MPTQPVEKFMVRRSLPFYHPMGPMHSMNPSWYSPRAMSGIGDAGVASYAMSAAAGVAFGLAAWWLMGKKKSNKLTWGGVGAGVGVLSQMLFAPKVEAQIQTEPPMDELGCVGGCW